MAKRKANSLLSGSAKRFQQDGSSRDLTNGQSVREQAEGYRLITAKFPVAALTPIWSVGSNRDIDVRHVKSLCQIFKEEKLQREVAENRLRLACSRAEVERMIEHLAVAGERSPEPQWPSFKDWMLVNGCEAEIMAGQHRVAALKVLLSQANHLQDSPEDLQWWLCDIYDKGKP
jgi:hypothetical protein